MLGSASPRRTHAAVVEAVSAASSTRVKMFLGGFVTLATIVVFAPLAVFTPRLAALRREAQGEYSRLASGHHRAFEARWLRRDDVGSELLGSPDVSSLADLGVAFENVTALRRSRWTDGTSR